LVRAVLAVLLVLLGLLSIVFAQSLLLPATNPLSVAAHEFQRSMWAYTIAGAILLGLAALLAPPRARSLAVWKVLWTLVGLLFLGPGVVILIEALGALTTSSGSDLARTHLAFLVAFGVASVALGAASLVCGWWRGSRIRDA
jgi:HAMP domain-containing protein